MIVTCSQDRTCTVWSRADTPQEWKPSMVVLKNFGNAATSVKWAPCETRFAVGSGAKQLQVCAYEPEQDWWLGKPIRGDINGTIFDIAFHPSSFLVAAGGVDKKICIYSSVIKALDNKDEVKGFFGGKPPKFGECLFTMDVLGYVNGLAFSPSGATLVAASHDSRAHFISFAPNGFTAEGAQTMSLPGLPLSKIKFLSESKCVGGGYDMVPIVMSTASGTWSCEGSIDAGRVKKSKNKGAAAVWADRADRAGAEEHEHFHTHSNIITSLYVKPGSETDFTTAGLDGRVVFWNVAGLEGSFAEMNLRSE